MCIFEELNWSAAHALRAAKAVKMALQRLSRIEFQGE
eukprot:IDg18469t1